MKHEDYVELLRGANLPPGGEWVDLGAGAGNFTMALRELVGPKVVLHAVDRDRSGLRQAERAFEQRFGNTKGLDLLQADFTQTLPLPLLDGILMANSLHFIKDKGKVLRHIREYLKPDGRLLLVEYNVDTGNLWVPHPLSFESFRTLAVENGFAEPMLVGRHPSSFLREMYAAQAIKSR